VFLDTYLVKNSIFSAINTKKDITIMANEGTLQAELTALKESLRIKEQSIANINPKYQMNQAYLAKLKDEVANLNSQIEAKASEIAALLEPKKSNSTPEINYGQPVRPTPYDETGNLSMGYGLNDEGEPYWTGDPTYVYKPPVTQQDVPPQNAGVETRPDPFDDRGNLNKGYSLDEEGNPVWVGPGFDESPGKTIESVTNDPSVEKIDHGSPRDDDGNLNPGWAYSDELGDYWVGDSYVSPSTVAQAESDRQIAKTDANPFANNNRVAQQKFPKVPDWRFRITLSPKANYLYAGPDAGILAPLKNTGVIFPYTPTVSVNYTASYDTQKITHSNYNIHNYTGSSVENITVTGDFTAQDISEANYLLGVIHFCRTATKMFYGKDTNPQAGMPPPLLYLSGFGQYQFDNHPVVLTNFTYTLPNDVDYINAYPEGTTVGVNGAYLAEYTTASGGAKKGLIGGFIEDARKSVLNAIGLGSGGAATGPKFSSSKPSSTTNVTRVPTKISISLTFLPIITRSAISNQFSLKDYASGKLLRGSENSNTGGGIW
jgi:hypothetical protein